MVKGVRFYCTTSKHATEGVATHGLKIQKQLVNLQAASGIAYALIGAALGGAIYFFLGSKGLSGALSASEIVLAEKLECVLSRGVANTRMRDFYDLHILQNEDVDMQVFAQAFANTCRSRCFCRSLEALCAVLEVFSNAYNAFGVAKMKFRHGRDPNSRELPFSALDFL
jgi:hypothetical protein